MNQQMLCSVLFKLFNKFLLPAAVCIAACLVVLAVQVHATPYVLDEKYESINVVNGEYRVNNNVWGANTAQQVTGDTTTTAFEVTLSAHTNPAGSVASYPFVQKGIHWGGQNTANSEFPIQVSDVVSAPFQMSVNTVGVTGDWNASFESFFSINGGTAPDGAELMIWLDRNGNFNPGGSRVAQNVSIGGINWNVYHGGPWGSWQHYIAYVLPGASDALTSVNLDLRDFMDDCLTRGYLNSNWYLDNMEAGFEIIAGGQGLELTGFSAAVNPILLPGDYNDDGIVDVLDYIVWRNSLGAGATSLPNDDTPGIGEDDFLRWKEHFGETAGGASAGALAGSAVPEPSSVVLMLGSLVALAMLRRVA